MLETCRTKAFINIGYTVELARTNLGGQAIVSATAGQESTRETKK